MAGYVFVHYFLFEHFVHLFKPKFQSSQLQNVFLERLGESMRHLFKLKINRFNNRDFNIDQNNHDLDFFFSMI